MKVTANLSGIFHFTYLNGAVAILLILTIMAGQAGATGDTHAIWSELLGQYVHDGVVDYSGLKRVENRLDEYLQILDNTDPQQLTRNAQLAFYINAYNAYTVKLILKNFKNGKPVASIKKLGSFFSGPWSIAFCRIGGEVYSLDNIEHDILRPQFREPRVHFAVNCASQSCPPLIGEAYVGEKVEDQLRENAEKFINDRRFNYLEGSTLYVSKIFKWFAEDFDDDVVGFLKKYAHEEFKSRLNAVEGNIEVRYLEYDWSLNNR